MSLTVNDHRRYAEGKLAEAQKAAEEKFAVQALLQQAASDSASTGNDQLDKFVRVIQESLNKTEQVLPQVATGAIHCIVEQEILKAKCDYFYIKGRHDAYKELLTVPAQIVLESKSSGNADAVKTLELVP